MLPRKPALIVFDLDGTLVDSAPDIARAIDAALLRLGREPVGEGPVRQWVGSGAPMLVKRALAGTMHPEADPPRWEEGLAIFMEEYGAHLCERSRLFPGVAEGLAALEAAGYRLACNTNKPSALTLPLLEQLGIARRFGFVGSGDQFRKLKPDPEPLLQTAAHFGVDPARCLMVGDSANDAGAARRAGFMLVCVPYGYHGGQGVEVLEPDVVVESFLELPALLEAAA